MPAIAEKFPLTDTVTPADLSEVTEAVRDSFHDGTPIYPLGGQTSMDFGLPPKTPGHGLSLRGLKRVIDYPARDMTITVEAGITIDALSAMLAKEHQRLPIDLPNAHRATLGGVIATNTSGSRRYAHGTIRDYVIGITAVDGRGTCFHGGGRVVKNVAGYDFCKLLVGSLGTLAVITQVTLRVKPIPPCSQFVTCKMRDWPMAERILSAMVTSEAVPAAIELLAGSAWKDDTLLGSLTDRERAHLVFGVEGTATEVEWMTSTLWNELRKLGVAAEILPDHASAELWRRLAQFPGEGKSPLVVQAAVPPSRIVELIRLLETIDPRCAIQSHAGNGVLIVRFSEEPTEGISKLLVGRLQPATAEHRGHVKVLSCHSPGELTRQCWWGSPSDAAAIMSDVKRQFDPKDLLNRGRFIFAGR